MHLPRPAALTRRAAVRLVVGGAVGTFLVGGCDLGDLTARTSSSNAPGQADETGPDPDVVAVDQVVASIRSRLVAVVEARRGFTSLREPLRALEDMHRAHLVALDAGDASSSTPSAQAAPADRQRGTAAARRTADRVLGAETAHRQSLVTAAAVARSGALARLLASMSASVAQHLAVLPDLSGDIT